MVSNLLTTISWFPAEICVVRSVKSLLLGGLKRFAKNSTMEVTELEHREAGMPEIATPERCEVAIVYFDKPSRDRAIHLCDTLLERFKDDLDFEFTWWNVRYLTDPHIAHLASEAIANSDLIVFAAGENAELSP